MWGLSVSLQPLIYHSTYSMHSSEEPGWLAILQDGSVRSLLWQSVS